MNFNLKNLYKTLEPYGIVPSSTMKEIDNCTFSILKLKKTSQAQIELNAINKLKQVKERIVQDFFNAENNPLKISLQNISTEKLESSLTAIEPPDLMNVTQHLNLNAAKIAHDELAKLTKLLELSEENLWSDLELDFDIKADDILNEIL